MRNSTDTDLCSLKTGCGKLRQLTSQTDRSDRHSLPVRPVGPSAEVTAESVPPVSVPSVDEAPTVPPTAEDEELVDYEVSPERTNMEINVVHLSSDYFVVPEGDMAHLDLLHFGHMTSCHVSYAMISFIT